MLARVIAFLPFRFSSAFAFRSSKPVLVTNYSQEDSTVTVGIVICGVSPEQAYIGKLSEI